MAAAVTPVAETPGSKPEEPATPGRLQVLGDDKSVVTTSGHNCWQKIQFAASLISPMAAGTVISFSKDIYILELAADVGLMGMVGTVLAIWGPLCSPIAGYLMEKDLLARFFPPKTWGRRAPWFLTHSIGAAFATAVVFLPPSLDPVFLCMWLFFLGLLLCWFLSVIFNCFESARIEMYPTKEERSDVEAIVKVTCGFGTGMALAAQLIVVAGATLQARALSSGFILLVTLISLCSVPILRQARKPYDARHIHSALTEFRDLGGVASFRHLAAYRFMEGALYTIVVGAAIYWVTFVEGKRGAERSYWIGLLVFIIGASTVPALLLWTWFFRYRRRVSSHRVCGAVMVSGCATPLILFLTDVLPSPLAFLLYCGLLQLTLTGQTFWRASAFGWIVDEDCLAVDGRRREALFVGAISLVSAFGRALGVFLLLNGLAFSGLQMSNNCQTECTDNDPASQENCVSVCELRNIEQQPESVRNYIVLLYSIVVPACQLICAVLVWTFPISGTRLDKIYAGQAELYGKPVDMKPVSVVSKEVPDVLE